MTELELTSDSYAFERNLEDESFLHSKEQKKIYGEFYIPDVRNTNKDHSQEINFFTELDFDSLCVKMEVTKVSLNRPWLSPHLFRNKMIGVRGMKRFKVSNGTLPQIQTYS